MRGAGIVRREHPLRQLTCIVLSDTHARGTIPLECIPTTMKGHQIWPTQPQSSPTSSDTRPPTSRWRRSSRPNRAARWRETPYPTATGAPNTPVGHWLSGRKPTTCAFPAAAPATATTTPWPSRSSSRRRTRFATAGASRPATPPSMPSSSSSRPTTTAGGRTPPSTTRYPQMPWNRSSSARTPNQSRFPWLPNSSSFCVRKLGTDQMPTMTLHTPSSARRNSCSDTDTSTTRGTPPASGRAAVTGVGHKSGESTWATCRR